MNARLLLLLLCVAVAAQAEELRSGYSYLSPESREMQDDEFANPGMSAVDRGRTLFNKTAWNGKSCASCHGVEGEQLDPAAIARYPVYDAALQQPVTLQQRINICWEERMDEIPFVYDCTELVALESFVRHRARGAIVNVAIDGPMQPYYERGKAFYNTRFGQINVSCAHCHELYTGHHLRGQVLTQGHSNGFPEYRLATGRITSLHGRFRECFRAFRAEPFESGAAEYIELEIYVNARGNGLPIETPAVRY